MAARENQGLQIALIIFVMLTVVLIVTTFLFFRNYKDEQAKSTDLNAKLSEANSKAATANDAASALKAMIGAPDTDTKEVIAEAVKKDMEQHGKTLAESEQNFRGLVKFLSTELNNANTRIADLTAQKASLADKVAADEVAKNAEIANYTATVSKTGEDLESERTKFNQEREDMKRSAAELSQRFDRARKEADDVTRKSTEQVTSLSSENTKLTKTLKDIHQQEEDARNAMMIPDGRVARVNQVTRTVWVNVGSDDGLKRQITFSVYDRDESNPADAKSKGKVEIVNLTGPHMAEARIIQDDLSNPIMLGDLVFSPAWQPGRAEHFAIAGFVDIDKDGLNDRQLIRDLITHNGGVVDAEVSEDGKLSGKPSINTKYLVLGEKPELGTKYGTEGMIAAYSQLLLDAQTYGVSTMDVNEFLDYMGYKVEDRTVKLNTGIRSSDFKARMPEGVQRTRPGSNPVQDQRRRTTDNLFKDR